MKTTIWYLTGKEEEESGIENRESGIENRESRIKNRESGIENQEEEIIILRICIKRVRLIDGKGNHNHLRG